MTAIAKRFLTATCVFLFTGFTPVFAAAGTSSNAVSDAAHRRVTISIEGVRVTGIVQRMTKAQVFLKVGEKERVYPLFALKSIDLYKCRRVLADPRSAADHFELAKFCVKKKMSDLAEREAAIVKRLDAAGYGEKLKVLWGGGAPVATVKKAAEPKVAPKKPKEPEAKPDKHAEGRDDKKPSVPRQGGEGGAVIKITLPDGRVIEVPAAFAPSQQEAKPPTPAEIEKFKKQRMVDLKSTIRGGAPWKMTETKHYRVWSDLPPAKHRIVVGWVENLFTTLSRVMNYKEGDPLWYDKCDVYFFAKYRQFQNFAVSIDRGMPNSGGYFTHRGRRVHIAIPFNDRFSGEMYKTRMAADTLYHEGTHAFLQLVGKDVYIHRWFHEGMAQLVEFVMDPKNEGRARTRKVLRALLANDNILRWRDGRERPAGGTDRVGYAFAWSRVRFLYEKNRRGLFKMIKLLKAGKTDTQAMEEAYGEKVEKLEDEWERWLKAQLRRNFPSLH